MEDKIETVNGPWIRGKLKTFGIKSSQLAVALGVSDSQIAQWLSGRRSPLPATRTAIQQYFSNLQFSATENITQTINPTWIRNQLKMFGTRNSQLAAALGVSDSQISQWLSGRRNPSTTARIAIQQYFSNLQFAAIKNGKDVLRLSNLQYLAVKLPSAASRYVIMWNHFELKLILHKCDINEMSYIDLTNYRYLLLDPEYEQYSILYEFQFQKQLQLYKKLKGELAHNFEVVYAY